MDVITILFHYYLFIILISLLVLLLGNVQQRNMKQEIYNREKYNNHTNTWKLLITLLIAWWNIYASTGIDTDRSRYHP